jgi:hypothetical protein
VLILDGLSYRRAGRMVAIPGKAGDSVDLLLGKLAPLGFCQPNGCPLDLQAARPRLPRRR